jgi:hypothetical protein
MGRQSLSAKVRAKAKEKPALRDMRWWAKPEPHQAVWDNFKRVGMRMRSTRAQDRYYTSLYDDEVLTAASTGTIGEFTPQTMATNIVRRQVDTFVAKVSKNRPVPMGLTSGGNYSEQRRAKAISKFFEGILDEVGYWDTRTLRLRDGGIVGSGFALNYRVGRKMFHDRIFKREVRVCPIDAERGKPRTMYIGRLVDKLMLAERFPKFADLIYEADADCGDGTWRTAHEEDTEHLALVIECWHLPSGENATDGAHVISISNATLRNDQYKRDVFPVSKFDFCPANAGYFGSGIAQQLEGLQYEVNSVGMRLQERHYLMGTYVTREAGSTIEYEQIDNGTLTELVYDGKEPTFLTPQSSPPDLFNWWRELRTSMPAEITGLSNYATRSEKPQGIIAAKAIRMVSDSDLENLTPQGRSDEKDVIDTCWQFFDLAEEIYAETGKETETARAQKKKKPEPYTISVETKKHGKSMLEDLDYEKVRIDKKHLKLRVFPTNFLRGTPEEQMQSVNEMIEAGFLSQDEAIILLDFPDLQRVLNLRTASRHLIERTLESFVEAEDPTAEGVYVYPEPALGLELCKALAIMTWLDEKLNGAPEGNLDLLMDFYLDADTELEMAKSKAAAGQMPSGAPLPDGEVLDVGDGGPLPAEQYAPPGDPLLPEGAVAPEQIEAMPPGAL